MSESEWLRQTWANLGEGNSESRTQRVSAPSLIPQYCAIDGLGRSMFYVKTRQKPDPVEQLAHLAIATKLTGDTWIRSYTLLSPDFYDEFVILVGSLVEASKDKSSETTAMRAQRGAYEQWLAFYKKRQGFNLSAARGLFGELSVLSSEKAMRQLTWLTALDAWKGPFGSPQDFIFSPESAVEVKTINLSAKRIKINGAEQLSFGGQLDLIVLTLSDGLEPSRGRTLNNLVDEIRVAQTRAERDLLLERLELAGYDPDSEVASERYFETVDAAVYSVAGDFPRLKSEFLPPGVEAVEYQIRLSAIAGFAK